jgi:hypothetical protein
MKYHNVPFTPRQITERHEELEHEQSNQRRTILDREDLNDFSFSPEFLAMVSEETL